MLKYKLTFCRSSGTLCHVDAPRAARNLRGNRVPGQLLFMGKQLLIRYFMSSVSVFGLRFCCMRADFPESKIYLQTSNASSRIINSLFYSNSSGKYGGAVSFNSIGTITLTNLTFYSNSTDTEGGAIYGQFYSYTVNHCCPIEIAV